MTVWLRHTNLYTCSPFWSFEQAQASILSLWLTNCRRAVSPLAEGDGFGYDSWQCFGEPVEAAVAIGYRAATFAEDAGMLNRAFCSSLSVAYKGQRAGRTGLVAEAEIKRSCLA